MNDDAFSAEFSRVIRELQRAEKLRARCFMIIIVPALLYFLFLVWVLFLTLTDPSPSWVWGYGVYAIVAVGGNGILLLALPINLFFRDRRKAVSLQNVLDEMLSYAEQHEGSENQRPAK